MKSRAVVMWVEVSPALERIYAMSDRPMTEADAEELLTTGWPLDDLGCHEQYDRNAKSARNRGFTVLCHHCGRGLAPGKGWLTHVYFRGNARFIRVSVSDEQAAALFGRAKGPLRLQPHWIELGPECGRSLPAEFRKPRKR